MMFGNPCCSSTETFGFTMCVFGHWNNNFKCGSSNAWNTIITCNLFFWKRGRSNNWSHWEDILLFCSYNHNATTGSSTYVHSFGSALRHLTEEMQIFWLKICGWLVLRKCTAEKIMSCQSPNECTNTMTDYLIKEHQNTPLPDVDHSSFWDLFISRQ